MDPVGGAAPGRVRYGHTGEARERVNRERRARSRGEQQPAPWISTPLGVRAATFLVGALAACLVRRVPALLIAPPLFPGLPLLAVVLIVPPLGVRCLAPARIVVLLPEIVVRHPCHSLSFYVWRRSLEQ